MSAVMQLVGRLVGDRMEVHQDGGFGIESKSALRSVATEHTWDGARKTWIYPYSPGSLQGLVDAANMLGFQLMLDKELKDQYGLIQSQTDHELGVRRLIQTYMDDVKLPIRPYETQPIPPPWRHQQIAWHWMMRVSTMYLALKPGCISGDAKVKVMRHSKVYATTLRDLYQKFNGLDPLHPWKKRGITYTKSLFPDGVLKHNEIKQVLHQGTKACVRVLLASGKEVTCTSDHLIAIQGGWKKAEELTGGQTVLTNGIPACRECRSTEKVITYEYAKYKGLCQRCAKGGPRHWHWRGGRQLDKDGYVLVSNNWGHPNHDRHGCVREHQLVMEKRLGRYLTGDERERVHHKNGVKHDNEDSNLELTYHTEHSRHHGMEGNFAHMDGGLSGKGGEIIFYPREDTVVSVTSAGMHDVYDLVMEDPARNFAANGIIVHNCGKTRVGADAIRGKHETNQVRPPLQFPMPERPSAIDPERKLPARWCTRGGVLVVCPRVVIGEWVDQLMRWQNIKGIPILGDAAKKRYRAGTKAWVHICAYDSLESVEGNEYDGIIGDELHYIANEESNRFQRMMALRKYATWVIGLSGTPMSNMLQSLWSQYYWLDGGRTLGPSYEAYRKKFFDKDGRKVEANETAETRIARSTSRITFFLTMQQAFPGKAQKVQTVIRVPMTKEQSAYYEMLRKKQSADIVGGKVTVVEALTKLLKLLQVTQGFVLDDNKQVQQFSSAKLVALEEMLTGKGDLSNERVIVWCNFRHDMTMITNMLSRHKIKHMQLHGDIPDKDRNALKDAWNNDFTQRVFVGMISMGIGINLHAPTCVDNTGKPARVFTTVFFGLNWRVTQLEQAMDRVYRGDQEEVCVYRYLLSDDLDESDDNGEPLKPIDVRIYECLMEKLDQGVRFNEESVDYVRRLLGS
jgi:SNF2-related domain/Intein splicing domain/Helicase conserved C-terminal domain